MLKKGGLISGLRNTSTFLFVRGKVEKLIYIHAIILPAFPQPNKTQTSPVTIAMALRSSVALDRNIRKLFQIQILICAKSDFGSPFSTYVEIRSSSSSVIIADTTGGRSVSATTHIVQALARIQRWKKIKD